jgi:hypothetical protein
MSSGARVLRLVRASVWCRVHFLKLPKLLNQENALSVPGLLFDFSPHTCALAGCTCGAGWRKSIASMPYHGLRSSLISTTLIGLFVN